MEQLLPFNNAVTEIESPVPAEAHHLDPFTLGLADTVATAGAP